MQRPERQHHTGCNAAGDELPQGGTISWVALLEMREGRWAVVTKYGLSTGGKSRAGAPSVLPAWLALLAMWAERECGDLWPGWKHESPGFISLLPKPPCATLSESFRLTFPPLKKGKKDGGEAGTGNFGL